MPRNVVIAEEITETFSPDTPQIVRPGFFAMIRKELQAAILREIPLGYQDAEGFHYGTPGRPANTPSRSNDPFD
jgi:hypothetical protein